MKLFTLLGRRPLFAAAVVAVFAGGAVAQSDTAYVPFVVNANATVTAVPDAGTIAVVTQVQMTVTANTQATLRIPLPKSTGVTDGVQKQAGIPVLVGNGGGKITLNVPAQSYKNAEISLYAVNGKRVLRHKASASDAATGILRRNIAQGAYLFSVHGTDGATFATRLTHNGGNLNIAVAFGDENRSAVRQLAKEAVAGDWTVTVEATGYVDSVYVIKPVKGTHSLQNISLRPTSGGSSNTFTDARGGKTYRTVTINSQTWMAENLNYQPSSGNSWCYDNADSNCVKYGRLYDWSTAMGIDTSYNSTKWNGSDVNHRGICPSGWHLPSNAEWTKLVNYVGGSSTAGKYLKSSNSWTAYGGIENLNTYGFSALSGGLCYSGGHFNGAGNNGRWWTATEYFDGNVAYYWDMSYISDYVLESYSVRSFGFSVRCVMDN